MASMTTPMVTPDTFVSFEINPGMILQFLETRPEGGPRLKCYQGSVTLVSPVEVGCVESSKTHHFFLSMDHDIFGRCVFEDLTHPTVYLWLALTLTRYGLSEMPNYRRFKVPGTAMFFTVVTHERRRFLIDPLARRCLREAFQVVRARYPFEVSAIVLLPDHLHALWTLPPDDAAYSMRWRRIKEEFTERYLAGGGEDGPRSASRLHRKECGVWQRRFWEHTIHDEEDFEQHCDYIHYNPVKHRLATCPSDWSYSSFHRWVSRQAYPQDWGCSTLGPISFDRLEVSAME